MAYVQIPNLPGVAGLSGAELFEGVQAGTSVKISLTQIISAARSGTPSTLPILTDVGGTGLTTFDVGDIMYASNDTAVTGQFAKLADVATGNALISGGVGVAPSYGKIGLTTHVSGVLPVANGGTNQSADLTQYGVIYGDTTTSMASTAAGTSTQVLHGNASGAPTWGAVSLTADVSGVLPVANGGTNISSYAIGDILYASTTGVLSPLADVATGNVIISGGVGAAPSYGKVGLTTHVDGVLPLANGGTGINAVSTAAVNAALMGYTSTATAAGTTTLTKTSTQYQLFTGSTTQTVVLPVTSTLTTGWTFHIVNNSTGNLTINASSGALVCTVIPGMTAMVTCIDVTVTTAAAWEFGFTDFGSVTGTGAAVLGTGPTITNGVYSGTVGASNPSTGVFTSVTNDSGQLYSLRQLRIFTSGTGASYTPTTGTKAIRVTIVGGGGGAGYVSGGGTAGTGGAGGGGGAGAVSSIVITSLSVPYTYTVGGGGAGGVASTSTVAANGGTTTFSGGVVSLSAAGGTAGISRTATAASNAGRGGNGGTTATGGTLNFAGQNGAAGLTIAGGSSASGGDGASGPYGAGGLGTVANGSNYAADGATASGYGAGGGGGGCFGTSGTTANGGAGSGGIIIVEELG